MTKAPNVLFENSGYCPCCHTKTTFRAYDTWLRDHYVCQNCGSIPRQRHLQAVLDRRIPTWPHLAVHESSPSNNLLSRWAHNYSASRVLDDVPRGQDRDGVRSEDLESLTFADESFDIFITQDVLEHVFHPERAIAEVHRVLKPGGAHVFTAPKHRGLAYTVQRARLDETGAIEHLLPEEFHGNPIGEKSLVTYDYGYDFEALLSQWSGVAVDVSHTVDRGLGIDAEFNEVFVISKPPVHGGALARAEARRIATAALKWTRTKSETTARRAVRRARRALDR